MLVGVRIWEIFSRKSSLKERARRASLFPRMLPLWPDDPGAPGVTWDLSPPPFSVGPPAGELLGVAAAAVQFPPVLLVMLDALFRGVVWVDVEMVTLEPDVALSQSGRLRREGKVRLVMLIDQPLEKFNRAGRRHLVDC